MKGLKIAASFLCGIGIGIGSSRAVALQYKEKTDKYERLFRLYESWLTLSQNGEKLEQYFDKNSFQNIAVYGYGTTGRALVNDIKHSNINVRYIVDKKKAMKTEGISLYHPNDELPDADAMVITPLSEGRVIKDIMENRFNGRILLIEDILYECL
ncbi:MAG: hypothetical protein NC434_02070 [Ruminococcus sp.]|nr:hypothetical protein [Ruminococcus sp.]